MARLHGSFGSLLSTLLTSRDESLLSCLLTGRRLHSPSPYLFREEAPLPYHPEERTLPFINRNREKSCHPHVQQKAVSFPRSFNRDDSPFTPFPERKISSSHLPRERNLLSLISEHGGLSSPSSSSKQESHVSHLQVERNLICQISRREVSPSRRVLIFLFFF